MEVLGSSTTRSEGYVQAAGTELQRENGVEDSVEALYEDIYSLYKDEPEVDAELIKQAAYDSTDYIQFLLDAGVTFEKLEAISKNRRATCRATTACWAAAAASPPTSTPPRLKKERPC